LIDIYVNFEPTFDRVVWPLKSIYLLGRKKQL